MSKNNALEFKAWVLKWVQGVIISFCNDRIQLNRVKGALQKAKKYGIKNSELLSIIESIENSPIYLPLMSYKEKRTRLTEVREIMDKVWGDTND
jgi:predicted secreted acid phosphatase